MIDTLKAAGTGWSKIFSGEADWASHFRLDAEGMNAGFTAYGLAVLVAIVLVSLRLGFPPPDVMLIVVATHLVPLLALILVTTLGRRLAGFPGAVAGFIVPGLYLIALMKVIEGVLVLAGLPLPGAIAALTGVLGFRLARANGLATAQAIGYGLVLFLLLAGLPIALYMLTSTP